MVPVGGGTCSTNDKCLPDWGINIPMYHGRTEEKRIPRHARPNRGRRAQRRYNK